MIGKAVKLAEPHDGQEMLRWYVNSVHPCSGNFVCTLLIDVTGEPPLPKAYGGRHSGIIMTPYRVMLADDVSESLYPKDEENGNT